MSRKIFKRLKEDTESFMARDPAARSRIEIFFCYPGFHALLFYRLSNAFWRHEWRLAGRFLSNIGKILTGIEIHPGAKIGRSLFIDHGNGVVIGETSEIGENVTLYQGVTLGGTSLDKGKRHPTLEDGVIVGSGAQILGPITLGEGARVGANAVVLKDVPKGATMVGIPARRVMGRDKNLEKEFTLYGTPTEDLPDPVARSFDTMRSQMNGLADRIVELEETIARLRQSGGATEEDLTRDEEKRPAASSGSS